MDALAQLLKAAVETLESPHPLKRRGCRVERTLHCAVEVLELQRGIWRPGGSYFLNIGWRILGAPEPTSWKAVRRPVHLGARAETLLGSEVVNDAVVDGPDPLVRTWDACHTWFLRRAPVMAREAAAGLRRHVSRHQDVPVCLVYWGNRPVAMELPGELPMELRDRFHEPSLPLRPWKRQHGHWYALVEGVEALDGDVDWRRYVNDARAGRLGLEGQD